MSICSFHDYAKIIFLKILQILSIVKNMSYINASQLNVKQHRAMYLYIATIFLRSNIFFVAEG